MYKSFGISLVPFVTMTALLTSACSRAPLPPELGALNGQSKAATNYTQRLNRQVQELLPFASREDFDQATRGFIATIDGATTRNAGGDVVYSLEDMSFLQGDAPDTVNPSLWRQAQLNGLVHGLFEVVDGIYQVRSFDLANMTLIAGETGWIIVDPLLASETAAAALALANRELGERPVRAIILTHSHVDHFGGIRGVVDAAQVADGTVPVVAAPGFSAEAFSENLRAGNVMERRASYQFGTRLDASATGYVSTGLGNRTPRGTTGLISPSISIPEQGGKMTLDGVEFEFMNTPGAEAPAELLFYLPGFRALCMSEIATRTLHNIYTLRGAKTRVFNSRVVCR